MRFLRQHKASLPIALTVIALVMLLTAVFWAYTQDDVFITYTYSRNLAQGDGFVFNFGERVQGTTTPAYTLIMAGVALLTNDLLHAGNLLSAIFLLATIGIAVSLTRPYLSRYARAAIALTLAVSPLIYVSFGMETLFYCTLLMLTFWLWSRDQRGWAMLAAAALTWTRADGIVLGGALGLIALAEGLRERPRLPKLLPAIPWRLVLIYGIGIAPWYVFAWAYFGSPLPNTFSAKQELLHGLNFWIDGAHWWQSFYGNNWLSLLALPLIGLGLWRSVVQRPLRPLAVWAVLYTLGYTALNITAFWYYTPLVVTLIVLAGVGGDWLLRERLKRRWIFIGAITLTLVSCVLAIVQAWTFGPPPPRVATYALLGDWLRQHTDPYATVVVRDLGIVGYHAQRRMIDSPGLIVPDMGVKEDAYAVATYKPDYVVATQYWTFKNLIATDWFKAAYLPVAQFSTSGDDFSPMTVYQRRDPSVAPATFTPLTVQWSLATLQGFALSNESRAWSGGSLTITLNWQGLRPSDPDYSVFVHLLNKDGVLVAQNDAYPRDGMLVDTRQIDLPPDLPPGDYHIEIGWYNWRTNVRLTTSDGQDSIQVPATITIMWPGGSGKP